MQPCRGAKWKEKLEGEKSAMFHPQQLLLLLLAWMPAFPGRPSSHLEAGASEGTRAQALKRLLEVFGIGDPPQSPQHIIRPPQYMVDLYNTVADDDGVTKDPDILEGNTVRSFLDRSKWRRRGGHWQEGCQGVRGTRQAFLARFTGGR